MRVEGQLTPEQDKKIFYLKKNYGLTNIVLADRFGCCPGSISNSLKRSKDIA